MFQHDMVNTIGKNIVLCTVQIFRDIRSEINFLFEFSIDIPARIDEKITEAGEHYSEKVGDEFINEMAHFKYFMAQSDV